MRTSLRNCTISLLSFVVSVSATGNSTKELYEKSKFSRRGAENVFARSQEPRFISFDSDEGSIDINWDVSIPFISIPLKHELTQNGISPLLNINAKALSIAGTVTAILAFIVPFFSKSQQGYHYRSLDDMPWPKIGNALNDAFFENDYIRPCMQRIVCSIVSSACHSTNPTSIEKIIDGLSSHKWFKDKMHGTIFYDAAAIGRQNEKSCSNVYKNCHIKSQMFDSIMTQFGAI